MAAFLRAINVASRNQIAMPALREALTSAGFSDVETYIQSGNVVFVASEPTEAATAVNEAIRSAFGHEVAVIVRSAGQLRELIEANPFGDRDNSKTHVTLLDRIPDKPFPDIAPIALPGDTAYLNGADLYLFMPNGYGRTKLQNAYWERKLGVTATTRNWNTMRTMCRLATGEA
jgi:uncharacterized protein (DUF1697 family)